MITALMAAVMVNMEKAKMEKAAKQIDNTGKEPTTVRPTEVYTYAEDEKEN